MIQILPCKRWQAHTALATCLLLAGADASAASVLFIGNSFTFGYGSPVRYYRADTVTDLNGGGQGGVPALFKAFADEAGLSYQVSLETQPGVGIDWHLDHKLEVIGKRPWDSVVMHGFSTLDPKKPGDPAVLIESAKQMTTFLHSKNPAVQIRLLSTWPRADQLYLPNGAWYGKPVEAMAKDIRDGYNLAAAASPGIQSVIPVGDAWIRAMHTGIADANPFDGIEAGKIDLWTYDSYHASAYGYYLDALVVFGSLTGQDPRSLGNAECAGFELGLSSAQVGALEQVAYEQLSAEGTMKPSVQKPWSKPPLPAQCAAAH